MKRLVSIAVTFAIAFSAIAQNASYVLTGKVTSTHTDRALSGAHITVAPGRVGAVTDDNGLFTLKLRCKKNTVVKVSYIGYGVVERSVHLGLQSDTFEINLRMSKVSSNIAPVCITARSSPDTVFGSFSYCVADFEFYKDKFLLLTYASRDQKASSLMLQDRYGEILLTAKIPGRPKSLYRDYEDRYYVICEKVVFRVRIESALLLLVPMSIAYFEANVTPGIDMIGEKIIFSDYDWKHPQFSYYTVWKHDTVIEELTRVIDKDLMRMYRFEYYFLNNEQRVAVWKLADQHEHFDEYDAAALMTGFQNTLYYDALYAPIFVVDDTVLLFDHYADKLYKYDIRNRMVDSVEIAYHMQRGSMKWRKELVKDAGNGDIYAIFQKNGYYYLNYIDIRKGRVDGLFKMSDKYAENMKIKDDYVYYVYDPQDKYQTPFLYREQIRL